jgi:bisphosphoglycerate-dependent phosphoglycerate mutase
MDDWVKTFDPPEKLVRREYLQNEINFWKRRYKINPTPIEWKDDGKKHRE